MAFLSGFSFEVFSKYLNETGIKADVVETLYGDDEEESEKENPENPES